MNVTHMGWGASQDAIRAACNVAGHEPKATRQRREPIPPIDYLTEVPSKLRKNGEGRKGGSARIVASNVVSLEDARARRAADDDQRRHVAIREVFSP